MNSSFSKPVIILGAGGHAKVVADVLLNSGKNLIGFAAPHKPPGTKFFNLEVLGDEKILSKYPPENILLANGVGAMPYQDQRWKLASRVREKGYSFLTTIHPSSVVAKDVELEEGVQIMAGSVIQPGTRVGRDSIINTGVLLDHDCTISSNCHLAPGVVLSGSVKIGEGSHIGTGTSVIQSISIGKNCVIAAGSIIYKNIPDSSIIIQKRH